MFDVPLLVILVVIFALAFDYINGFHDTANAIATVVSTRVLTPTMAIAMAAVLNFVGALVSTGVAQTVATGLVTPDGIDQTTVLGALIGAIVWNLLTWYYGIPSSSSHALMGGIVGAALAHAGTDVIVWGTLTKKVLIPIFTSPIGTFIVAYCLMKLLYFALRNARPSQVSGSFRWLQILSATVMAFSHGSNDAQKSMGIITMALLSANLITADDPTAPHVPSWVVISCAVAMALGTAAGGWRIIKTMGHKIVKLEPVHGFAAETSASITLLLAASMKAPISTTHAISGAIFGVGAAKRFSAVRWAVARQMVVAWFLTVPASAGVAAFSYYVLKALNVD